MSPSSSLVRVRLQVLRNFHAPVLSAGEQRLRAAMAEYAAACEPAAERGGAYRGAGDPGVRHMCG